MAAVNQRVTPWRGLVVAVVSLLGGLALATLSRLAVGTPAAEAMVRVAVRTTKARVETCRERGPQELAALPAHLRAPLDCEVVAVDYRLTVVVDGTTRADVVLHHGGVRHSRPLIVDEALAVVPGRHQLEVSLRPELGDVPQAANAGLASKLAALPAYSLDQQVDLVAGRIALVTLGEGKLTLLPDIRDEALAR